MLQAEKNEFVSSMQRDLKNAQGVIFLDYTGLTVAEVEQLRRKLRAAKVGYKVVKNTLMARALKGTPAESLTKVLKGTPTGVVLGVEDPVSTAKLTFEFLKECEHLKVKGGILDEKPLSAKETESLSKMPSKAEILGQILGMIMGPSRRVIAQIKNPAGKVVAQIDKLAEGKDEAAK